MKRTEEERIFDDVCLHNKLNKEEIELCRIAYQNCPESGRITYASLYEAHHWREEMNKGITERIKKFQELKKAMKAKAEAEERSRLNAETATSETPLGFTPPKQETPSPLESAQ